MTTNELQTKLTINIKNYLKLKDHVKSGRLLNSLEIKVSDTGKFEMSVIGLEYMLELDEGEFLQDFFNLDSTIDLIAEYFATNFEKI